VRFHIDHAFTNVTAERFLEVYFSEDFNNRVAPVSGLKTRTLVEETVHAGGARDRRVRMHPDVDVPAALRRFVRAEQIHYDEVSHFDPANNEIRYRIDSRANDRVTVSGVIRVVPEASGVRRLIDTEVAINAPFGVGAVVERFVEAEVTKGYAKLQPFLQQYLDDHARKARAQGA
jgi:hypothetical protein